MPPRIATHPDPPRPRRAESASHLFALLLIAISIRDATPVDEKPSAPAESQTALYAGTIGKSARVLMQLTRDGDQLAGDYVYVRIGEPIDLAGTLAADGRVALAETAQSATTGRFEGAFKGDNASSFEGVWRDPEGKRSLEFKLRKAADCVDQTIEKKGKLWSFTGEVSWPRFILSDPKRAAALNARIKKIAEAEVLPLADDLEEEGKDLKAEDVGDFPQAYQWEASVGLDRVAHFSDGFVSLALGSWAHTGGAHGNGYSIALNLRVGEKIEDIKLSSLFKPGADWLAGLNKPILADLRKKEAMWVVNGEVTGFKEEELSFCVSEGGLTFFFSPYAVGPYVQGPFETFVPFKAIKGLLDEAALKALIPEPKL